MRKIDTFRRLVSGMEKAASPPAPAAVTSLTRKILAAGWQGADRQEAQALMLRLALLKHAATAPAAKAPARRSRHPNAPA